MSSYRWRVRRDELHQEFKDKSSSPLFFVNKQAFVLDVYASGVNERFRDGLGVYLRYVGHKKKLSVEVCLSIEELGCSWSSASTLGLTATKTTRTRVGTPRLVSSKDVLSYEVLTFLCEVSFSSRTLREASVEIAVEEEASSETSEVLLKKSSRLTQSYRDMRFAIGIAPIVYRYSVARSRVKRIRQKLKNVDENAYYDERTVLWDAEHEKEAPKICALFEKMGGLYNKLAQDWATRDGMLPQAWVRALKGSFEALKPREWAVMKKCMFEGLQKENVAFIRPSEKDLAKYFASISTEPLAAASIGQVHEATTYENEKVVVKAIYPEIRRNLVADLANARRAAHNITWALKLPMKGSVDAIMDEQCASFPRELDLRAEAQNILRARFLFQKHNIKVQVPRVLKNLSSSSVLTQTFVENATTMANYLEKSTADRDRATKDMILIAEAVGITLFREKWYHSDPHPGNCMVQLDEGPPALIDWGHCTLLTNDQLRTVCHLVLLLGTKSAAFIDVALSQTDFDFNTTDTEHRVALLYYLFDSSRSIEGVVSREAMEFLQDAIRYTPKRMPVLTTVPREVVFYGRVVATLRKSFDILDADVSVVDLWQTEARNALKKLNSKQPQLASSLLLLLPKNIFTVLHHAPNLLSLVLDRLTRFAIAAATSDQSLPQLLYQTLFRTAPLIETRTTGLFLRGTLFSLIVITTFFMYVLALLFCIIFSF